MGELRDMKMHGGSSATITSFANFETSVDDEYEFDYELHPHSLH